METQQKPITRRDSNNWGMAIPVLLFGIPGLFINFFVARFNDYGPLGFFDYYVYAVPVLFIILVILSSTRRSQIYLLIALMLALGPLVFIFGKAYIVGLF